GALAGGDVRLPRQRSVGPPGTLGARPAGARGAERPGPRPPGGRGDEGVRRATLRGDRRDSRRTRRHGPEPLAPCPLRAARATARACRRRAARNSTSAFSFVKTLTV